MRDLRCFDGLVFKKRDDESKAPEASTREEARRERFHLLAGSTSGYDRIRSYEILKAPTHVASYKAYSFEFRIKRINERKKQKVREQ